MRPYAGLLAALAAGEAFTPPAYCNRSFLKVTHAVPVEAKRYAVVLNRHCYRGFSGIDYRNKDSYVGTQRAVDMQLALINSVLGNVVLPLEHLGFDVDVFLVAHDPAPHNATKSAELWDLLIRAFGGRVVATKQLHGLGHGGGRDFGQGTAMVETFRLLEKHSMKLASQNYFGAGSLESHGAISSSPYRAVLINRFDVAFTDKLGPADRGPSRHRACVARYATRRGDFASTPINNTRHIGRKLRAELVKSTSVGSPTWLLGARTTLRWLVRHLVRSPRSPADSPGCYLSKLGAARAPLAGHGARRVVDRQGRALLAPSSPGGRAEAEQQMVGPGEEPFSVAGRLLHLPRALRHLAPRRGQVHLSVAAGVLRGAVVRRDVRRGRHVRPRPGSDRRAGPCTSLCGNQPVS